MDTALRNEGIPSVGQIWAKKYFPSPDIAWRIWNPEWSKVVVTEFAYDSHPETGWVTIKDMKSEWMQLRIGTFLYHYELVAT